MRIFLTLVSVYLNQTHKSKEETVACYVLLNLPHDLCKLITRFNVHCVYPCLLPVTRRSSLQGSKGKLMRLIIFFFLRTRSRLYAGLCKLKRQGSHTIDKSAVPKNGGKEIVWQLIRILIGITSLLARWLIARPHNVYCSWLQLFSSWESCLGFLDLHWARDVANGVRCGVEIETYMVGNSLIWIAVALCCRVSIKGHVVRFLKKFRIIDEILVIYDLCCWEFITPKRSPLVN